MYINIYHCEGGSVLGVAYTVRRAKSKKMPTKRLIGNEMACSTRHADFSLSHPRPNPTPHYTAPSEKRKLDRKGL